MPEVSGETSAPEKIAEETAALTHEDGATLHETDKDGPESPDPIDFSVPGDVVVSFDKINEIVLGKQASVKETETVGTTDKKAKPENHTPDKGRNPKGRPPKTAEKTEKNPIRLARQEKPPLAPELSSEPREAPRPGEQSITQMVEDNTNQHENILPSERAKVLQMQLEAIKKQGARIGNGQRPNEVVAERNKMTVKQVQRYIAIAIRGLAVGSLTLTGTAYA
ncbi:hypothetical protein [Tissierella praeacuta]|uniref:hypothetical protein n=1 Tax=Tissierella praeacuta TaxID=43131 RepID=UPI003341FE11